MLNNKILLIEDDIDISEMVKQHLEKEGFLVDTCLNGEEAVCKVLNETYNLILLDLMLPKINGMDVLKVIRENSNICVLILSAKVSEVDKALGLGFGADDYITKPFSLIELTARIKANIRRATQYSKLDDEPQVFILGELKIDLDNYIIIKNGEKINLTAKEYDILRIFVKNPSRVYTKQQIYNLVWKENYYGDENVINVHISRLREKIEDDPSHPKYIKTIWGIGYKLGDF